MDEAHFIRPYNINIDPLTQNRVPNGYVHALSKISQHSESFCGCSLFDIINKPSVILDNKRTKTFIKQLTTVDQVRITNVRYDLLMGRFKHFNNICILCNYSR